MQSHIMNGDIPKQVLSPTNYPYPDYPMREFEGTKTQIDNHGGYWDFFKIASLQE